MPILAVLQLQLAWPKNELCVLYWKSSWLVFSIYFSAFFYFILVKVLVHDAIVSATQDGRLERGQGSTSTL
jgi:hypothetical protein